MSGARDPRFIAFDPQPAAAELPARFPSPFDRAAVHPLARRAAGELIAELRGFGALDEPGGGKMFGVLVVAAPDGTVGYLRGFSGMLGGTWDVPGFVPAAFDVAARDAVWLDGEREMHAREDQLRALDEDPATQAARADAAALAARHAAASDAMRARHGAARAARHARRAAGPDEAALHALAQESRADTAERRRLDAAQAAERAETEARVAELEARRAALVEARAARSRTLLVEIHDAYRFASGRGTWRSLRELFAPDAPPGGAGDCAAPKLLAYAYRAGLRPLALAEVWWGAPPRTGGRHAGSFYPACRGKCGPILAHMLDGLDADPPPLFGAARVDPAEPRTVYEDRWIAIVEKPCGLLSVPGRSGALRDSVQTRLRARYPDATGPLVVHRLDLDTSGLLLAARDEATYTALQRAFARREIDKRYVAWLDGELAAALGDHGVIELPLRVDLDDRPRQIVDPLHGKPAVTSWRVLERAPRRTRVELTPHTGRTHQLRVHAAHPLGLAAPIVGDRLYGRGDEDARLLLHAASLAFTHPHTGERIAVSSPPPF